MNDGPLTGWGPPPFPPPHAVTPPAPGRSRSLPVLAAIFGPGLVWGVVFLVAGLTVPARLDEGTCGPIGGGGCSFSPQEATWIVGLLAGVPVVAVAILLGLLAQLAALETRRWLVAGLVLVVALVGLSIAVAYTAPLR